MPKPTEPKIIGTLDALSVDKAIMFWLKCHNLNLYVAAKAKGYDVRIEIRDGEFCWDMVEPPKPDKSGS